MALPVSGPAGFGRLPLACGSAASHFPMVSAPLGFPLCPAVLVPEGGCFRSGPSYFIQHVLPALGADRGMYKYYGLGRHMVFWHQLGTKPIGKRVLLLPEPRPGPPAEPKIICHPEAGNTKYIPLSGERARVRVILSPPKSCPSIDRLRMILRRAQDVRERPDSADCSVYGKMSGQSAE